MSDDVSRVTVLGQTVRVSVRRGTEPGRPPLVLCNGIGARLELLQPFVDHVDPRVEVVRFDVPGVGGSPPARVPYTFAGMAWLLAKVLTRLGYDTFDVLGISWGGGLAQHFADGACAPACVGEDDHATALRRAGVRHDHRG